MLRIRPLFVLALALLLAGWASILPGEAQAAGQAQNARKGATAGQAPIKRLILKDGSYQIITQYKLVRDRVRYYSAEREEWEEMPAALVDWPATEKWAKEHVPGANASPAASEAAAIDQEEQQEKAAQMARTPEVAAGLRLPDQVGVWALDTFQAQPKLVPLVQDSGDINRRTGHNVLRSMMNPQGGLKRAIELPGAIAKVQLHVDRPAIYVSLTTGDADPDAPGSLTVDTHGAGSIGEPDSYSSPASHYAIVRVWSNLRRNYRMVSGIKIGRNGDVLESQEVIPTAAQVLPGKHWLKLTPGSPLTIGDYALVEILSSGDVNASVWDFRIDPQAEENQNAIMPLERSSR